MRLQLFVCLAAPRLELMQLITGRGLPHPLYRLLIGNKVHIGQLLHIIQEFLTKKETVTLGPLKSVHAKPTRNAFK